MSESTVTRRQVLGSLGSLGMLASGGLAANADDMQAPTSTSPSAAARRAELYGLLEQLPDRNRPISGEKLGETERDGYVLETWRYDLNGIEPVPAYVAHPPCPKATVALLSQLERLVDTPLDFGELPDMAKAWERGVDELAAEDAEVAE